MLPQIFISGLLDKLPNTPRFASLITLIENDLGNSPNVRATVEMINRRPISFLTPVLLLVPMAKELRSLAKQKARPKAKEKIVTTTTIEYNNARVNRKCEKSHPVCAWCHEPGHVFRNCGYLDEDIEAGRAYQDRNGMWQRRFSRNRNRHAFSNPRKD